MVRAETWGNAPNLGSFVPELWFPDHVVGPESAIGACVRLGTLCRGVSAVPMVTRFAFERALQRKLAPTTAEIASMTAMRKRTSFPTPHAVRVDWDTPHLQALIEKTEAWQIDHRGSSRPAPASVFLGWGALSGKPATLVLEDDHEIVFLTDFPIAEGEKVRIDKAVADTTRHIWGVVAECRDGRRDGDPELGVRVVRMRKQVSAA